MYSPQCGLQTLMSPPGLLVTAGSRHPPRPHRGLLGWNGMGETLPC